MAGGEDHLLQVRKFVYNDIVRGRKRQVEGEKWH